MMGGGMEEMMMAMMMEDMGSDMMQFEKMMGGKSAKGKGGKGPDLTAAEAAMMEELFGSGPKMPGKDKQKTKPQAQKSDDEWETDSDEE